MVPDFGLIQLNELMSAVRYEWCGACLVWPLLSLMACSLHGGCLSLCLDNIGPEILFAYFFHHPGSSCFQFDNH